MLSAHIKPKLCIGSLDAYQKTDIIVSLPENGAPLPSKAYCQYPREIIQAELIEQHAYCREYACEIGINRRWITCSFEMKKYDVYNRS